MSSTDKKEQDKTTYLANYREIDAIIDFFAKDWLPESVRVGKKFPKGAWHAVFSIGTVVPLLLPDDQASSDEWNVVKFHEAHPQEFPVHRLANPKDVSAVIKEAQERFDKLMVDHKEHAQVIRAAFSKLMNQGYPLPGGPGADSETLSMRSTDPGRPKQFWCTMFPNLTQNESRMIMSIVSTNVPETEKAYEDFLAQADAIGREVRRLDFMMPRLVALISADLQVLRF